MKQQTPDIDGQHDPDMQGIKKVVAQNLRALMEASTDLRGQVALADRAGVAQATISNFLNADYVGAPNLLKLARIARAFRIPVWVLLYPDLDPRHPPVVLTPEQRAEYEQALAVYAQVQQIALANPQAPVAVPGADDHRSGPHPGGKPKVPARRT